MNCGKCKKQIGFWEWFKNAYVCTSCKSKENHKKKKNKELITDKHTLIGALSIIVTTIITLFIINLFLSIIEGTFSLGWLVLLIVLYSAFSISEKEAERYYAEKKDKKKSLFRFYVTAILFTFVIVLGYCVIELIISLF